MVWMSADPGMVERDHLNDPSAGFATERNNSNEGYWPSLEVGVESRSDELGIPLQRHRILQIPLKQLVQPSLRLSPRYV